MTCIIRRKSAICITSRRRSRSKHEAAPKGKRAALGRRSTCCHARGMSGMNSLVLIYTSRIPEGSMNRSYRPQRHLLEVPLQANISLYLGKILGDVRALLVLVSFYAPMHDRLCFFRLWTRPHYLAKHSIRLPPSCTPS